MLFPVFGLFAANYNAKIVAARIFNNQIKTLATKRVGLPDLDRIHPVEVDAGRMKYLLFYIKVDPEENPSGSGRIKTILRGYVDCEWHMNIYERVTESCELLGFKVKCAGGGELIRDTKLQTIKVFGRSEKYGPADPCVTKNLLSIRYPDYRIVTCDRE